jgi:hypothetical protein
MNLNNYFLGKCFHYNSEKDMVQFVVLTKTDILFTMQKDDAADLNVLFKIPSENQIEIAE